MIAAWMLGALVFSTCLSVAALAAERLARIVGRGRRWPWLAAMIAGALWPPLSLLASRTALGASLTPDEASVLRPAIRIVPDADSLLRYANALQSAVVERAIVAIWLLASLLMGLRLVLALRALRRVRERAQRRVVDGTPVLLDERVGPATIGVRDLAVIVPRAVLELDEPMRVLVLRHEREHCEARDPWLLLAANVTVALFPWNVALLWIRRRLHLALEIDCDARVLAGGAHAARYGRLLLWTAQHAPPQSSFAPTFAAPPSHLERRIIAMRTRLQRPRPTHIALATSILVVALMGACSAGSPDAPSSRDVGTPSSVEVSRAPAPARSAKPTVANAQPYFEFQVEKQVRQLPATGRLRYPDSLRAARVEGEVLAQFVIDSTGRYLDGSLKVLRSTHPLFTKAVAAALPTMRFAPAEIGGARVRQVVQQPFTFSLKRD